MLFGCVETNQGSNEINSLRRRANTSTLFVNSVDHIWREITRGVKLPEYSSQIYVSMRIDKKDRYRKGNSAGCLEKMDILRYFITVMCTLFSTHPVQDI